VLFDKATYEKLLKEVPSYKLITPSVVSERLKVRGSLARKALDELLQNGKFVFVKYINLRKPGSNVWSQVPEWAPHHDIVIDTVSHNVT
jgi:hypothetical protein